MKNIISLLTFFIVLVNYATGQCVNGVETNPNNPQNNTLPINNNQPDPRFINGFSWILNQNNYNIPLNDMGLNPGEYYGNMEPINSNAYLNYYYYLNENYQEVMLPENGWEIISDNRGYYPDNTSSVDWQQNLTLRKIPYLLFYNKYSGIARFFVRYGNNEVPASTINAVELTISHQDEDNMSGLLRLGSALDRALDKNSITHRITTKVPNPGGAELWFSGDFQLAYDPCICNHESQISLDFNFITSAKIELHGRSISTTSPIVNSTGAIDNDFLSGISNDTESGFIIYEHMKSLIEDYEKKLKDHKEKLILVNRYNDQIEKYLQIIAQAKILYTLGPASAGLYGVLEIEKFSKELSKVFAGGFDLLLKEDFKKKPLPQAPSMPTVSFTEMNFSGEVTYDSFITGSTINTPGSENANVINLNKPTQYPTYNEVLGQFALVETPKLEIYKGTTTECFTYDYQPINVIHQNSPSAYDLPLMQFNKEHINQIRLKEDLKYTFNPVLPIKNYTMEIGLEVRRKISYPESSTMPNSLYGVDFNSNIKHFHSPKLTANFNSIDINVNQEEEYKLDETIILTPYMLNSNVVKSICYAFGHKTVFKNPGINYNNDNTLHLEQVDYLANSVYGNCNSMNDALVYEEPYEYYVKVQLNVTYEGENTSGDPIEYNYLFTYKIEDVDITVSTVPLYNQVVGTSLDISQYPENLVVNGVNFDGSQVEGCKLVNNSYNCQAWNNVTILGNNTVSSGYQVFVKAGSEIEMLPEAVIAPEMELSIVQVLDFSDPMQEMEISDVKTFCASSNYIASQGVKSPHEGNNSNDMDSVIFETIIQNIDDYVLYPNPANNKTFIKFHNIFNLIDIELYDVSGRKIETDFLKAENIIQVNLANLVNGAYMINIKTDKGTFVENLIVY